MSTVMELVRKLRSMDSSRVTQAVEELRVRGWLADGSLAGIPLCHAHLQGADLLDADFHDVDFHQAELPYADLSHANLRGCHLSRAQLRGANFSDADLTGVDLFKADLRDARNLTDEQLRRVKRLWGAIMPDGTTYDGRYNLEGDLNFARWGRVDVTDPEAMANFLQVPLETYLQGQARQRLPAAA